MEILETLNFGAPAAERDDDLLECFVSSETYEKILSGDKTVILGNRGTGKSALFKKLSDYEKAQKKIVIELAPDHYSYEMLSQVMRAEGEGAWHKQGAYSVAWKYLIYIKAFRELTKAGPKLKTGKHGRLYEFVRDNIKDVDRNPIGVLISYMKRLEGVKIGKYEASIKTRELTRLYKLEEIEPLVEVLDDVASKRPVIILVDELDKGWDASEDAVSFVSGLFHAAMSINSAHKNLRVVLSLRRELYDNIPAIYDDAQKFRDVIEFIHWDEDQLFELACRRIAKSGGTPRGADVSPCWVQVFEETLGYRKAKSFNYIIDRTLFRPRELIHFCNEIVSESRSAGLRCPLGYQPIAGAESRYSEARIHDIASEYRHQYAGLNSIFETFRGKRFNMSKDDFDLHLLEIQCGEFAITSDAKWFESLTTEEMLKTLWEVGFIRVKTVGGVRAHRRSGSEWMGSYQISSINIYDMPAYQVHPMFRAYLGMKEK